jgi:outer membrane protein OmpA-like peptidoglycan-associated protein
MADETDDQEATADTVNGNGEKQAKSRPGKVLPTDRVTVEKQLAILRGYCAASGPEKKAVSNADVSKIVGVHAGSISNCNPFFGDTGLLVRDGVKYRPTDEVFNYSNSYQWDPEKAAHKLAPILKNTWFAATLLPKLAFRSFSKDEAVKFLADEAKASPEYRQNLEQLVEYLKAAGLIAMEGNMVAVVPGARSQEPSTPARTTEAPVEQAKTPAAPDPNTEEFSIPIPGKASARIIFPKGLEAEDWDMLKLMLDAYIRRLRKESLSAAASNQDGGST